LKHDQTKNNKHQMSYANAVIYKIQNRLDPTMFYVGGTNHFKERIVYHKSKCADETDVRNTSKIYTTIRENGGWNAFDCNIIKSFPCETKGERDAEEQRVINELKPTMNTIKACHEFRDDPVQHAQARREQSRVWSKTNAEKNSSQKKIYREEHAEHIAEYLKDYRVNHREELTARSKLYYQENKEQSKKYQLANADKITNQLKTYRKANRVEINRKQKEVATQLRSIIAFLKSIE